MEVRIALSPKTARTSIPSSRHRPRILALQALYEFDTTDHSIDRILDVLFTQRPRSSSGEDFIRGLIYGIIENRDYIDQVIAELAPSWPVSQLAPIDRCILRLAIYEVSVTHDTPPKAAINEAVELCKDFVDDTSHGITNSVLQKVFDQIDSEREAKSNKSEEESKNQEVTI